MLSLVCTLHQPCSRTFELLDRLILMKDGNLVYQGKAKLAKQYFEEINIRVPEFCNPADFFLEAISDPAHSHKVLNENYQKLCEFEVRDERVKIHEEYKSIEINLNNINYVCWFTEYALLLHRTSINYIRNNSLFLMKIFNYLIISIIISSFYFELGKEKDEKKLFQNYTSFFFNNISITIFNAILTSCYIIGSNKSILKKESSSKLYRLSSFYLSLITSLLIYSIIYAIIYTTMTYIGIQFLYDNTYKNIEKYLLLFLSNFFKYSIGQCVGIFIGSNFEEKFNGLIIPFVSILFYFGAGFYRGNNTIPSYISWLFYGSPYKYFMELELNLFADYNELTNSIPERMGFSYGPYVCFSSLIGFTLIVLIFGYVGIKYNTAKF